MAEHSMRVNVRAFISQRDPRLIVVCLLSGSTLVWALPTVPLLCLAALCISGAIVCGPAPIYPLPFWPAWLLFLLFWAGITGFSHYTTYTSLSQAFGAAGLLLCRLGALASLALMAGWSLSPVRFGQTLTWFLTPILRKNAWKAGLAVCIMLALLPTFTTAFRHSRMYQKSRFEGLGFWAWFRLLGLFWIRLLDRTSHDLALAIACRDLYHAAPWAMPTHQATTDTSSTGDQK